jgi:hypothetical protein
MAERRTDGPTFPPELRDPRRIPARIAWLRANGLRGALTEIRAMTNPRIARRLREDPDYSIGTPRRR